MLPLLGARVRVYAVPGRAPVSTHPDPGLWRPVPADGVDVEVSDWIRSRLAQGDLALYPPAPPVQEG